MLDVVKIPPKREKPPKEPTNKTESLYGPIELWMKLAQVAKRLGRSKSDLAAAILEDWLNDYEKSHGPLEDDAPMLRVAEREPTYKPKKGR